MEIGMLFKAIAVQSLRESPNKRDALRTEISGPQCLRQMRKLPAREQKGQLVA